MHVCNIMRDNISMDRQNTLKRDNAYNMKHSFLKMYVLSRFSFNMKYLTRTDVHVEVGYYMGSAIEIPKFITQRSWYICMKCFVSIY